MKLRKGVAKKIYEALKTGPVFRTELCEVTGISNKQLNGAVKTLKTRNCKVWMNLGYEDSEIMLQDKDGTLYAGLQLPPPKFAFSEEDLRSIKENYKKQIYKDLKEEIKAEVYQEVLEDMRKNADKVQEPKQTNITTEELLMQKRCLNLIQASISNVTTNQVADFYNMSEEEASCLILKTSKRFKEKIKITIIAGAKKL